ncbi:MAG: hypothetical protein E7262_03240 [Lachnospiraceae bacterium]|nr:hypothetical protein [Lachnospiraceae bacterium]
MSVLNIQASNLKVVENIGKQSNVDYSFLADKGDILEGVVGENNKVIIDVDGEDIVVDNSDASDSKVGDTKRYEVMESSKNKLVLKELKEENTGINEKIDINNKINPKEMQHSYETQEIKQSLAQTNEQIINSEMEKQLTDKLDKTVITMSPEDIRAIEAEGKSIEDMDVQEIYNKIGKLKREKKEDVYRNCGNVDKNVDNSLNGVGNIENNQDIANNSEENVDIVRKSTPKMGIIIENSDFKAKIQEKIQVKYFDDNEDELPEEVSHIVDELFDSNVTSKLEITLDSDGEIIANEEVVTKVENKDKGCITKDAIKYIISNELDHTLDNIYKAKFAGSKMVTHNISDEDFEQLSEQVKEVIAQAGYEITEENINVAKWLIESDIPLTVDTFTEYFELTDINKYTKEDIQLIANDYVADDVPVENMIIGYVDKEEIKGAVENFSNISDEAIKNVISNDQVLNLRNLLSSQRSIEAQLAENSQEDNNFGKIKAGKYLNIDKIMGTLEEREQERLIESQTISARRNLEEMRLKLTIEASNKLALKGFSIATEELSSVVEELRNIENSINNHYAMDLKDNYEGQKLYDETISTVESVKGMSGYVLAATYVNRDKITIAGLYEEGNKSDYAAYKEVNFKISRNADRFNSTFETIMTMPRKDMGDSISKAFRNVDDILTEMGMEITELNQRAVRILGYNNTEITKENIASVKIYDYEVNKVLQGLTPAATVELIKNGKNPLNMTFEELGEELVQIKANLTDDTNDSYSKYLWKLDKQNQLSAKERDAYIGIYRLIHQVEKSDGAVIGAIMNSGKELTLKNLLTEARVRQNKGINVNIDDLFGAVESVTRPDKAIDAQIAGAFIENDYKINKKIFKDIKETISPTLMHNAVKEKVDIMNMPIEKLMQYIEEQELKEESIDKEYYEYKLSTINEIADNTNKAIKLLTGLGMETTMNNVIAASDTLIGNGMTNIIKKFVRKNEADENTWLEESSIESVADVKDSLIEKASNILNLLDERDKLNYAYTEIEEDVKSIIRAYKENYDNSELSIEELRSINRNIVFAGNMRRKECYEVPIVSGDEAGNFNITNVNLTIIRNSQKHEVSVNFESQVLGRVEARFTYKDNSVKGLILGDNTSGIEMLKNNYESFKRNAFSEDINIKQLDYGINNKINYTFSGKDNGAEDTEVSTKKLYSLSKAFIMNIKETEEQVLAQA